jgi:hypothetical protein
MSVRRVIGYAAVPAAAVCALGLFSATAWASTPSAPSRPAPHPGVSVSQCRTGHGHVIRDRAHAKEFVCQGGKFAGRPIHF